MAIASKLNTSSKRISKAIRAHKTARVKEATFGGGWITIIIGAIREFCRNWPSIKSELEKAEAFLRENEQPKLADSVRAILTFLGWIAKICPLIPYR
jgi:hypothetical protein